MHHGSPAEFRREEMATAIWQIGKIRNGYPKMWLYFSEASSVINRGRKLSISLHLTVSSYGIDFKMSLPSSHRMKFAHCD